MSDRSDTTDDVRRREYLTGAGGLAVASSLGLAGCLDGFAAAVPGDDENGGSPAATGTLATRVTDQPGDIADFESCVVTIDGIWVKPHSGDDANAEEPNADDGDDAPDDSGADDADDPEDEGDNGDDTADPRADDVGDNGDADDGTPEDADGSDGRTYYELDEPQEADLVELQGANTQLVDERILPVGEYQFLQLDVIDVEGVLEDGQEAVVEMPGEAPLQFKERFEIRADERTTFVADVVPVRRGRTGEYLLEPVARGTKVLYGDEEYELDDADEGQSDGGEDNGADGGAPDAASEGDADEPGDDE